MSFRVKVVERNINTGAAELFYRVIPGDRMAVEYSNDKVQSHINVYVGEELVAYFPHGSYVHIEKEKENA